MKREKKALFTALTALLHQIISLVCGFILPRLFLSKYGSTVNGLTSSIAQFLSFITLAECGVGAVVQSSLYKPLADRNIDEISKIFKSSNRFFRRIGGILLGYTFILALVYPFIVLKAFDFYYTSSLILIISVSTFAQYYIGMSYRLILGADQLGFINQLLSCSALIINTVACFILINFDMPIHIVKLASSLIFFAQPIILLLIGKKKYSINFNISYSEEPIKQKWNGFAQHVATVINNNTDTVVLTLFSTLENVSVYAVYHLVVNGVKSIVSSFTSGYIAMFGNMLAKRERELLETTFGAFEWLIHTVTTFAFVLTGILIVPFVSVYTRGVEDVNYIVPMFGFLISIAQAAYCYRLPYNIMVMAAGHYKQTQISAVIEAVLNILVSVFFVFRLGLSGVAIGTLVAMLYRTCYLALYLSKNILKRNIKHFIKHCAIDVMCFFLMLLIASKLNKSVYSYLEWILFSLKLGIICFILIAFINVLFYRNEAKNVKKYLFHYSK